MVDKILAVAETTSCRELPDSVKDLLTDLG